MMVHYQSLTGVHMSEHEYEELWHYSEQFSTDKLQRSELVTMAWKQGEKVGSQRSLGLMKSVMHFRSKELDRRSAFPAKAVGKSGIDAWNHERLYLGRRVYTDGSATTLADFLLPMKITPLDYAIANDFMDSLTDEEHIFVDDLLEGYSLKDIAKRNHFSPARVATLRQSVREKAAAYL